MPLQHCLESLARLRTKLIGSNPSPKRPRIQMNVDLSEADDDTNDDVSRWAEDIDDVS